MEYLTVKWLHVVSSTFLFGTGVGSAFYLLFASLSRDARAVAVVARLVVMADVLFTATTVVLQPLTGIWLVQIAGLSWRSPWLAWSVALYVVAIGCWLPVLVLQVRMRDLARAAATQGTALPPAYWRCLRIWAALGVPAFASFLLIFWLMVRKGF